MAHPKAHLARRGPAAFLQCVIVVFGIGVLALMLWEPHLEGRNASATLFEIYFKDPFLAYAYIASIPFFVALYHGFKVVGYAGRDQLFSTKVVEAVRTIKICAIAIVAFVAVSALFMIYDDPDDRPPGVFMRLLVALPSLVAAATAAMTERTLRSAVDMKAENDLTV